MANALADRLDKILHQNLVTGIDFIYVYPDQKTVDVHFLHTLASNAIQLNPKTLLNTLTAHDIRIYNREGEVPDIHIAPLHFTWLDDNTLHFTTLESGDFTLYNLQIDDIRLDSFYNNVPFSFKANCPSDLDCLGVPAAPRRRAGGENSRGRALPERSGPGASGSRHVSDQPHAAK